MSQGSPLTPGRALRGGPTGLRSRGDGFQAGRAASNNATYRDIIRASLILNAQYLVLLLPVTYRFSSRGQLASVPVFMCGLDLLSALYASQRLSLPLRGVLLVGY